MVIVISYFCPELTTLAHPYFDKPPMRMPQWTPCRSVHIAQILDHNPSLYEVTQSCGNFKCVQKLLTLIMRLK